MDLATSGVILFAICVLAGSLARLSESLFAHQVKMQRNRLEWEAVYPPKPPETNVRITVVNSESFPIVGEDADDGDEWKRAAPNN